MTQQALKLFLDGLKVLGLKLSDRQLEQFSIYLDELKKWNEKFNLIGPATDEEIVKRHFLDSLSILSVFPVSSFISSASVLDIGTGAGFPGIPIKIAAPAISLTLLDSSKKKTEFLRHLAGKLGIKAEIVCGRADSVASVSSRAGKYDIVVARAVAKMSTAEEMALRFLNKNGLLILQIGNKTEINLKYGELMKKIQLPEKILPGKTILLVRKKNAVSAPTGFTLIELMIVVAIIGILAAVAIPKFSDMITKTKQGRTKGELGALRSAITLYYGNMEGYMYPQDAGAISNADGPFQTKYLEKVSNVKLGLSIHNETNSINDFADGAAPTDLANWGYTASTGKMFVNCTHTDTSGNVITGW